MFRALDEGSGGRLVLLLIMADKWSYSNRNVPRRKRWRGGVRVLRGFWRRGG